MPNILRERQVWKRPSAQRARMRLDHLTVEQEANVRAAMRVLRIRMGSWQTVAAAMGTTAKAIDKLIGKGGRPTAGLAMHAARLAGVSVDDVLSGAFPKAGSCPMCGRCE